MQHLIRRQLDGAVAHIAHTDRSDGDLSPSLPDHAAVIARRHDVLPLPWQATRQVHSDRVIVVDRVQGAQRPVADALVTNQPGVALAVHSGDCVPVGFISNAGVVGAAHAGWKGLEAGVLESTVRHLRRQAPAAAITAAVGPHIRSDRYEFGSRDLARLAARFGADVVAMTATGAPALDLTAAIASELDRLEVTVDAWSPDCTAAGSRYWSHRARQEAGRFALVAWIEETP